jgi:DNA modification methylase
MIDLRLGDCLELMKGLPDASVDFGFADPPYNSGLNYGEQTNDRREDYWEWLDARLVELLRISRCVVVKHSALKIHHFLRRYDARVMVWYKPFSSGFPLSGVATHWEPLYLMQGKAVAWSKDVFEFSAGNSNSEKRTGHPAQFPEALAKKLITTFSAEGETVFDAFYGSGTMAKAAQDLGRDFIGCEISPTFFDMAQRRIAEAQQQIALPLVTA